MTANNNWQTICHKNDLIKHSGICALLTNEAQVAVFYLEEQQVYTISNFDPVSEANIMSRSIVGCEKGDVFIASPMYKQRFSLVTGACLDDDSLSVLTYATRIQNNQVQVEVA